MIGILIEILRKKTIAETIDIQRQIIWKTLKYDFDKNAEYKMDIYNNK